jgi:site-specific DNA-methyltransferase (adenine-specific)
MQPYFERDGITLHHGDCLDVLRRLENDSVDCILTDPPYSSGGQFRGDRTNSTSAKYQRDGEMGVHPSFSGDNRDQRSYGYWCALWLGECLRVARDGSPIGLFTDWRQLPTTTDALQAGGWVWRGIVVWDKTEGARPQAGRFRSQAEFLVWGSKGEMPPRIEIGALPGVFRYVVRKDDKHHQAGKPTPLLLDLVKICPIGGTILDPFAGSGTTGVAASKTGRSCILIEQDPQHLDVIERRIRASETPLLAGLAAEVMT